MAETPKRKVRISARRAKRSVAYFADKLLNVDLHQYQVAVIEDKHDTVVWAAGRGAGKTLALMVAALWKCWTTRDFRVVYVAARFGQAKLAWDVAVSLLQGTPLMDDVEVLSAEKIALSNGAAIHFVPGGNPTAIRGFHARYNRDGWPPGIWLIIDEAAFVLRDTYVAGAQILVTAPRGRRKMFICGSPQGMNSFFYTEFMVGCDRSEKYTASYQTSAEGCPHISQEYLEQEKAKLTPAEYNAEICAQFQESLGSFFGEYVDPAIEPGYELPWTPDDGNLWQVHMGLDLSGSTRVGSDFDVIVVAGRRWPGAGNPPEDEVRIFEIVRSQKFAAAELRDEVIRLQEKYQIRFGVTETYNIGAVEAFASVYDNGRWRSPLYVGGRSCQIRFELIHPSNESKHESIGFYHYLLREGILRLPSGGTNAQTLIREMKSFSYSTTDSGLIKYAAMDGCKDDVVMATNYALWGLRFQDHAWMVNADIMSASQPTGVYQRGGHIVYEGHKTRR